MDFLKQFLFPVHKEGHNFVAIAAAVAVILSLFIGCFWPFGLLILLAVALFFRDPERVTPEGDSLIVAPADGLVTKVEQGVMLPDELEVEGNEKFTRVSIFLSVLDVHVNRVPASGVIKKLHYHAGKFLNATLDKSSEENERQLVLMETEKGEKIVFVQIAGLIARRILCDLKEGDSVEAGDRFGIIRFGSRMDVYVPEGIAIDVIEGQRAVGGETIIADLDQAGSPRVGLRH